MHLTLGILRQSQAVFYALAFFWLDGFAVPTPAQVTQTVSPSSAKYEKDSEMKYLFDEARFQNGSINFTAHTKPVSMQNKNEDKMDFKNEIQKITADSEYIITGTCWVHIDYYCQHIKRFKHPGVYDIDNIVKPILDSLVGNKGILVDDVLVDRVLVNWIDTSGDDYIEINLEYPDLVYLKKSELVILKSRSGWCFPTTLLISQLAKGLIQNYFNLWNSIETEEDYYKALPGLPIQNFIYFGKIKDRGYTFIDV